MLNLQEQVTRAEVIGWSIASPLCLMLVFAAHATYGSVARIMRHYRPIEDQLLPMARFFAWLGDVGFVSVLLACAALPVLALVTRQRPWILVCAPVICGMLAFAFMHAQSSALLEPSSVMVRHYESLGRQYNEPDSQTEEDR